MTPSRLVLSLSVCTPALFLAACGGGGSRLQPTPAPPPVTSPSPPPPSPPPAPPPTTNFDDAEYRNSNGANTHGAIQAYNAGGRGQGVKIGIIDSGINPNLSEFAGKIDPASRDVASNRGIVDNEGHGTSVSAVAAARRDGAWMMGVAFDSTIISLNTANPNDCEAGKGCKHSGTHIAQAIDIARQAGARVINISLGSNDGVGSAVLNAVARAAQSGIVIVMSAGNDTNPNPGSFALNTANQAGGGHVIIAGAHDASRNPSAFSNRAGTGAAHYLSALGTAVHTIDQNGARIAASGTSFAAPVISGAVALMASAFPNLTGAQIVEILFRTADDAGAPGRDAVYGNGILNIQRAFAPIGQTTAAGSSVPVSANNGQGGGAMGDGGSGAGGQSLGAVILDGYSRAYAVDLARTIDQAPQEQPLRQGLGDLSMRAMSASAGGTSVTLTVRQNLSGNPEIGLAQTGLSYEDSRQAHAVAALAMTRLGPDTAVALGLSESGRTLQQRLSAAEGAAFLIARDPLARAGFHSSGARAIGVRHDLGPVALTVTSEAGSVHRHHPLIDPPAQRYAIGAITADRRFGPLAASFGVTRLEERDSVLGGRFAFAPGTTTSYFFDSSLRYDLGGGWQTGASYRRGWTALPASRNFVTGGQLSTDAFAVDLAKTSAFFTGDRLALRLAQPLRVRGGGYDLNLPVSYDYADGSVGYEARRFNLAPSGRELDLEAAYGVGLLAGRAHLGTNLYLRRDPGHIRAMPDDVGGAIRFTLGW